MSVLAGSPRDVAAILNDPLVRAVLARFPGACITDVRVKPSVQAARKRRS
ncbi:hypothetical protein IPV08_21790 [Methylobacterium sp. SD274]|nr:hypothetical protein [Methylobacterium sp. SD274]MBO1022599.1 hypothetical protein [Methylobacterium sp. SD274]